MTSPGSVSPPPTPDPLPLPGSAVWYNGATHPSGSAWNDWANRQPISSVHQLFPSRAAPAARLALFFRLAAKAWAAMAAGQFRRACFYYDRILALLRRFPASDPMWLAAPESPGASRTGYCLALLAGPLASFAAGLLDQIETDNPANVELVRRASVHGEKMLSVLSELPAESRPAPCLNLAIRLCWALASQSEETSANRLAAQCVQLWPENSDARDLHIDILRYGAMIRAKHEKDDAKLLRMRGIVSSLSALESRYRDQRNFYREMGIAQHQFAILLANCGYYADALEAIAKSETHSPGQSEVAEARTALIESMKALQARMQVVESQLASNSNSTLTTEGRRLLDQSRIGFLSINAWEDSTRAKEIAEAYEESLGLTVLRQVGIVVPEAERQQRAAALLDLLGNLLNLEPPLPSAILHDVDRLIAEQGGAYSQEERVLIARWLELRKFGIPAETISSTPSPAGVKHSEEDWHDWLFSTAGARVKLQWALALFLLLGASAWAWREERAYAGREAAWRTLQASALSDQEVLDTAARYFSFPRPLREETGREERVRGQFAETLLHWVDSSQDLPQPERQRLLARYRAIAAGAM